MTRPIKWGLLAAIPGLCLVLIVVWGVQRYQDRLERETHAPERLLQRLMAVQAGEGTLQPDDLDVDQLRAQENERIMQLLARDLSLTPHPDPDQALSLLAPGAVSLVADEAGLIAALTRRLQALTRAAWQTTVVDAGHWQVAVGETCLALHNRSTTEAEWRWTSISRCDAD